MHENKNLGQIELTDPVAIAHSEALRSEIIQHIKQNGDMPFEQFMQMALYQPGMGYYTAGSQKFGSGGDFVTAPEISPLFSQALAQQCAQVLSITGGSILEFGAGSGIMAAHILKRLQYLDQLPEEYLILDVSADLRQRQRQTIEKLVPQMLERVRWLDQLPQSFDGVMLANEVLDAMPVAVFRKQGGVTQQKVVTYADDELSIGWQQADEPLRSAVDAIEKRYETLAEGYVSEVNLKLDGWLAAIAETLQNGVLLLVDYGYNGFEYYHRERYMGTLICHYQHKAHDNPLILPGLQDITANVDFSAVAQAARQYGLQIAGYAPQANFLMAAGIEELIAEHLHEDQQTFMRLSQAIKVLMLPTEMGERFKVLGLSKNVNQTLDGFAVRDFRDRL